MEREKENDSKRGCRKARRYGRTNGQGRSGLIRQIDTATTREIVIMERGGGTFDRGCGGIRARARARRR